jgi:hypothetical protein
MKRNEKGGVSGVHITNKEKMDQFPERTSLQVSISAVQVG